VASSLLCRAGAIDSYYFDGCIPTKSLRGHLVGEWSLTVNRVGSAIRRAIADSEDKDSEVCENTMLRLIHAIASSHRYSGVKPMTKEAIVLNGIVRIQNDVANAENVIAEDQNDDVFTAFDPRSRRQYYKV
jgi:hypothetical protein